jgi:hypothetical protein
MRKILDKPYLVITGSILMALLVIPMLFFNVKGDPRLIPYFDHDEGYSRDLAWYYYSGERTETLQYTLDHGVELQTIVDLFVRPLSLFIQVDQGAVLLVIRLFHFVSGMLALFFLWRFLKHHFPSFWIPTAGVFGLLVSPHFVWGLDSVKEEPFLVLLVILGLEYTLRIIEEPSWKNLILAVFFSTMAFGVKLVGLFILPGILLSLYLVNLVKGELIDRRRVYYILKNLSFIVVSILAFLVVFLLIIIPVGSKMYLSMKTDNFDLEKFASSFEPSKYMSLFVNTCIVLLIVFCIVIILWFYRKDKFSLAYKRISIIPLFVLSFAIVGYRWLLDPFGVVISRARWLHQQHAAPLNLFKVGSITQGLKLLIDNITEWLEMLFQSDVLGLTGLILIVLYFFIELSSKSWRPQMERIRFFKRLLILSYCVFFMLFVFLFQSRHAPHHLIIINILLLILGFEGVRILLSRISNKRVQLVFGFCLSSIIVINFWQRGFETVRWRINKTNQRFDIVFTMGDWFKNNYPYDTKIVADAPTHIYIPSEFKNVIFVKPRLFLDLRFRENPQRLKRIIEEAQPKLIFYNEGNRGGSLPPSLPQLLPEYHFKKIKEFRGSHYRSRIFSDDIFVVYELVNGKNSNL